MLTPDELEEFTKGLNHLQDELRGGAEAAADPNHGKFLRALAEELRDQAAAFAGAAADGDRAVQDVLQESAEYREETERMLADRRAQIEALEAQARHDAAPPAQEEVGPVALAVGGAALAALLVADLAIRPPAAPVKPGASGPPKPGEHRPGEHRPDYGTLEFELPPPAAPRLIRPAPTPPPRATPKSGTNPPPQQKPPARPDLPGGDYSTMGDIDL